MDLDILYEDSDLLVLDKPAGLVVHPAPGNPDHTLVNALLAHCGDSLSGIGGVRRPGIVHRLDKDTSGVMVVAKNDCAHHRLAELFAAHDLTRIYQAAGLGRPPRPPGARSRRPSAAIRSTASAWRCARRAAGPPSPSTGSSAGSAGRWRPWPAWWAPSWRPAGPIRCASIWPISAARSSATRSMAERPERRPARGVEDPSGGRPCMPAVLEFRHPRTGREMSFATELPQDISMLVAELNDVK